MTHLLVVVGDLLSDGHGVLQSSKPELGDTLDIGTLLGRLLLLFLIVLIIGVGGFTSFNITIGRLGFTGDNSLSSFVQWSVFTEELIISTIHQERVMTYLLLELEDGELEFRFNFRVLGLNTFQTVNPPSDRGWQAVDVSRRFTD